MGIPWVAELKLQVLSPGTSVTTYDPPELSFDLPTTFGTQWSYQGTSTTVVDFGGYMFESTAQESFRSIADAYGTLILPGGKSLDALRIMDVDTITIEKAPGVPITTITTSFEFVAKTGEFFSVSAAEDNPPNSGASNGYGHLEQWRACWHRAN